MRLALLFLAALCFHAQASVPTPIFVLHAYSQEYPWTRGQHQGFVQALNDDSSRAYSLNVEYLDTKRAGYSAHYADLIGDHLRKKYQGYRLAAEGVEHAGQEAFLLKHGCVIAQGYLYARPMPERELLPLLRGATPNPLASRGAATACS